MGAESHLLPGWATPQGSAEALPGIYSDLANVIKGKDVHHCSWTAQVPNLLGPHWKTPHQGSFVHAGEGTHLFRFAGRGGWGCSLKEEERLRRN